MSEPIDRQVGQQVDAFVSSIEQWIPGSIVYVSKNKVCVQCDPNFTRTVNYKCVWVKNTPEQLAPIYSHSSTAPSCNPLHTIVSLFKNARGKPSYYKSKDGKNIILMPNKHSIRAYDIDQRKETDYCFLPNNCYFHFHTHVLHIKDNTLYLFGNEAYLTLKMTRKEWNVHNLKPLPQYSFTNNHRMGNRTTTTFCQFRSNSPILYLTSVNQIHVIDGFWHCKFNPKTSELIHIGNVMDPTEFGSGECGSKAIWMKSMKRIFVFKTKNIYYCEISDDMQKQYKWEKFKIVLEHNTKEYDVLYVSDYVIMIYYRDHTYNIYDVYCIDFLNQKLFKCANISQFSYLNVREPLFAVALIDKMVHFIGSKHYKWSINKIVPKQIKDKDELLVVGYVKNNEKQNLLSNNVPYYVSKLMLKFYSIW